MWLLLLCESSCVANGCFAASVVYGRHGFSSGGLSPFARSLSSSVHSPAFSREVSGVFISALVLALGSPPMCWPELREYRIRFSDPDRKLRVASYESVGVTRSLETRLKIDHPSAGISTWSLGRLHLLLFAGYEDYVFGVCNQCIPFWFGGCRRVGGLGN